MLNIKKLPIDGYETVIEITDKTANLHAFISVHSTLLGPSLGGLRIHPYSNTDEALQDVLRLSQGMTYKSALAELGLGGGKSVIIADPKKDKTKKLLTAFAKALNYLEGKYICAEDSGSGTEDMAIIRRTSQYVVALATTTSSGDPSPFTAWGVFRGIQASANQLWGSTDLKDKIIAVQGLGHVGAKLAEFLFWHGAKLILSDIHEEKAKLLAHLYNGEYVDPKDIHKTKCDIFSPCALGGILNNETIPELQCLAIAGSANNQLLTPKDGKDLVEKNILYAPDYVISAGGLMNVTMELLPSGYNSQLAQRKVHSIYEILTNIFEKSTTNNLPTNVIADEIAEHNLTSFIGKRETPVQFHHKSTNKIVANMQSQSI